MSGDAPRVFHGALIDYPRGIDYPPRFSDVVVLGDYEAIAAERDSLKRDVEAARAERDRAIETRENANTVSVRVEGENAALQREVERLESALRDIHHAAVTHDYDRISGMASNAVNLYGRHLREALAEASAPEAERG